MPGKYIILDGIDFCGKGTQINLLHNYIFGKNKRYSVFTTREPTYGKYGAPAREILAKDNNPYSNAEECFNLFPNDRKEHIQIFEPLLGIDGHIIIVLEDRERYATLAYQAAQGIETKRIIEAHKGMIVPDLVLIIDITVDEAIKRAKKAKDRLRLEKFEKNPEFMEKVRKNYLELDKFFPDHPIFKVNGMQQEEYVFNEIRQHVDKILLK